MDNIRLVLEKGSQSNDPFIALVSRALIGSPKKSTSVSSDVDDGVVDSGGITDVYHGDSNIAELKSIGVITDADTEADPVLLALKLAQIICAMRSVALNTGDVGESVLDSSEVSKYESYYRTKLSKVAGLVDRYDEPLLFHGLNPNEAAGLARALLGITGQSVSLWHDIAARGKSDE